jgi:hypothetical protein
MKTKDNVNNITTLLYDCGFSEDNYPVVPGVNLIVMVTITYRVEVTIKMPDLLTTITIII